MGTAPLPLRLRRVLGWHRRKFAAGLAAIAVLAGINAAVPPDPPTVAAVVTARPIPAGTTLADADLQIVRRPPDQLPTGSLTASADAVGRTVVAPRPAGAVLTAEDLLSPRQAGAGRVVVPVRLADPDLVALLRPGDVIDIVAAAEPSGGAGKAAVLARSVRVVTVPSASAGDPGLLGSGSDDAASGVLCLVAADPATASALAGAGTQQSLSLIWSG